METQAQAAESLIDLASTKEDSLRNAIRATELYMRAAGLAKLQSDKVRLRAKCQSLLSKAEQIKSTIEWSPVIIGSSPLQLKPPISSREISPQERRILLESSRLNGNLFPPWTSEPDDLVFENSKEGETLYTYSILMSFSPVCPKIYSEPTHLSLSEKQRSIFGGWKRPLEHEDVSHNDDLIMSSQNEIDLVQDVSTDCSVVASLCAVVSQVSNGHGQLIASIFYPHNKSTMSPKISKSGKYIFRLQFNGCFRKVTIDDRLPKSINSRSLHTVDRNNGRLIWPALLEKAYLKLYGGYDFPGSNSGTDLWIILGWIPEQVFLQSDIFETNQFWTRIYKAFGYGDVLITLGTGQLTHSEEVEFGLVGKHDYAVLDLKEINSKRLLLIKNPWSNGIVWQGTSRTSPELPNHVSEEYNDDSQGTLPESSKQTTGKFWMDIESVTLHFEHIYLSWNPGLFRHRQDHHFNWVIPKVQNSGSFIHNPQYSLKSKNKETVWVLLSRHSSTDEQDINKSLHNERQSSFVPATLGYISLYVHETSGHRVYLSDDAIHRGAFVDSPQTLARIDVSPSKVYTVVIAQHGLSLPKYSFTLSYFSRYPLVINEAADEIAHNSCHSGVWNIRTAGGNSNSSSFLKNPQYSISILSTSDIILFLEAHQQDIAIHVCMVWAGGERVTTITSKDVVGGSGQYRRGYAMASLKNITAGKYTIVCSTFEPGKAGDFTLHVGSSTPCDIMPISSETAGRLSFNLEPFFFSDGFKKMSAPLKITRLTKLKIVARCEKINKNVLYNAQSLLKLSVQLGNGPNRTILGVSGENEFNDASTDIRLKDIDLSPEMSDRAGLWVVVERYNGGQSLNRINVEILSDSVVIIGSWCTGDG
ncbi:Calpain-like protease palB [Golovinomyces cichoracearum]|uniref:Calpain-like protease palB n=1 Tax=Golovinomyces cichoracearum TaxID=62708 RepID=A0A420J4D9_9PEZI|nr:Calpain-like protease palB [Golovinomyces cichoracearum]